jgi:L-lactate dehydrogenase (cytochrome)
VKPADFHTVEDLRAEARRRLPRMVFDFVDGGAEEEVTMRANRSAFEAITFDPRYMRGVGERDISTTILGTPVRSPVMLAPTGLARLAHRDGELGLADAAGREGSIFVVGIASGTTLEAVAERAEGPLWFQLYLWKGRTIVEGLVERARAAGYRALCVTVDVPVLGNRERDIRNGMRIPPKINLRNAFDAARRPRWLANIARAELTFVNMRGVPGAGGNSGLSLMDWVNRELHDPGATWDEVAWLREIWDGPLVVKGITHPEDARSAVDAGADGVVVSNHGGRQLDGGPATITALPGVVAAVGDRAEVLLDSGVRRGSDVVKAIALGARACLVGRPYWYGLAAGGTAGAQRMLEILNTEIDRTLALVGRSRLDELDPSVLGAGR